ncbi:formate/nitrite transporter family protein [Spiroplasma taiwanense]|uniref:Formate/nitrite transporter n=1 Tax=Spiroplasma taiwanense CT-1 TaxID=1276220 RepID=S5LWA7_9MOLU|nr:formate/nitrite transporter family protein [Spiroplasma taiwanense]AGR40896.1 formate/nitrite transporter [Spiroplasma taiwanense CT-1]
MNNNKIKKIEEEIKKLKEFDYSLIEAEHSFMVNGTLGGFKSAVQKLEYTFFKQILLGIMSGVIIGFGYIACITAMVSLPESWNTFGIVLLGFIFPGCIILITFLGGGLFTSHVFSTIPVLKKCASSNAYFKGIFGVLLGNILGTLVFVLIFAGAGGLQNIDKGSLANKVYDMAMHKLYLVTDEISTKKSITAVSVILTIGIGICSGILCNIMVCATLPLTNSTKNPVAVFLFLIFPIAYFAIGGFQHGPANTFFLWMMLVEIIFRPDMQFGENNISPEFIHFILFIFLSTIPTLIGNWIGGAIFLPGILYLINSKYTSLLFKKMKLEYLEKQLLIKNSQLKTGENKNKKINV